jgi:hypothetical protein
MISKNPTNAINQPIGFAATEYLSLQSFPRVQNVINDKKEPLLGIFSEVLFNFIKN